MFLSMLLQRLLFLKMNQTYDKYILHLSLSMKNSSVYPNDINLMPDQIGARVEKDKETVLVKHVQT